MTTRLSQPKGQTTGRDGTPHWVRPQGPDPPQEREPGTEVPPEAARLHVRAPPKSPPRLSAMSAADGSVLSWFWRVSTWPITIRQTTVVRQPTGEGHPCGRDPLERRGTRPRRDRRHAPLRPQCLWKACLCPTVRRPGCWPERTSSRLGVHLLHYVTHPQPHRLPHPRTTSSQRLRIHLPPLHPLPERYDPSSLSVAVGPVTSGENRLAEQSNDSLLHHFLGS